MDYYERNNLEMETLWLLVAFILGFISKQIGLPPLVGFLTAGFVLNAMGIESSSTLEKLAEYGILLLLFSIGLKLKIKTLFRPEIWGTATVHMTVTTILFGSGIYLLGLISFSLFTDLDFITSLLIAFALSFSSTVFTVKILEGNREMSAPFGNIAIGILILQDIFAVIFLSFSKGDFPNLWTLALLALALIPKLIKLKPLSALIDKAGHGELLVLLGVLLPIGTAELFELVNLKPDLGAIIIGVLLATHPKAGEISKAMLGFKDIFLIGFFLTIGLAEVPTWESLGIAALLTLALPIKIVFFYLLMTRLKLKARTATKASFSLSTYSEFGLIVGVVGAKAGWLSGEWLVVFALALSLTFILASPLNKFANNIYAKLHYWLVKFETSKRLAYEEKIDFGETEILVLGMGKMGTSAYNALHNNYGVNVLGIDYNEEAIKKHKNYGRKVLLEDATDTVFWERACTNQNVNMAVIAVRDHATNLMIIEELKAFNFTGKITATALYKDEMKELKEAGANKVFNFYTEAGSGFADHIYEICEKN